MILFSVGRFIVGALHALWCYCKYGKTEADPDVDEWQSSVVYDSDAYWEEIFEAEKLAALDDNSEDSDGSVEWHDEDSDGSAEWYDEDSDGTTGFVISPSGEFHYVFRNRKY